MTVVKPIARPLPWLLILAALAVYAAMSLSHASAPHGAAVTLTQRIQTEPPAKTGNAFVQALPPAAGASGVPSAAVAPVDTVGRTVGVGVQRFADAGPGVGSSAATQAVQSCIPKLCPRPQR